MALVEPIAEIKSATEMNRSRVEESGTEQRRQLPPSQEREMAWVTDRRKHRILEANRRFAAISAMVGHGEELHARGGCNRPVCDAKADHQTVYRSCALVPAPRPRKAPG